MLDDLQDMAGEGDLDQVRSWRVEVLQVDALPAEPAPQGDSLNVSQLWMRLSVQVHVGEPNGAARTQVAGLAS